MNRPSFVELLNKVQAITFTHFLATVACALMLTSILILWEAKTAFLQRQFISETQLVLSANAPQMVLTAVDMEALRAFTSSHPEIAAVEVVSVDLPKNVRTTLVTLFNDPAVESQMKAKQPKQEKPLFTADLANNAQATSLLDGQFSCSQIAPEMVDLISTICRVPVPPYYGKLTGYLVFHVTKELSIYEVDRLRRSALRLSIDLYYANSLSSSAKQLPLTR